MVEVEGAQFADVTRVLAAAVAEVRTLAEARATRPTPGTRR